MDAWLASAHRDRCLRVLIELSDGLEPTATEAAASLLLSRVRSGVGSGVPILLHGQGTSTWPALRCAGAWGLATRIGLEDVLTLPDGSPAPDNAALVGAALAILKRLRAGQSSSM